nr:CMRF35-like molecule 1 [Paramormyrops kingsleyae]
MSTVTVHSGGSVTIPCFYDKMYQHHEKYWCKGSDWSSCTPKVRTNRPKISGEVSIRDDPNQRFFTVTMNNLKTVDSDDYWCAVEISRGSAVGRRVYLSVTEGVSTLSTVTVQRGGSVTIPCAYDDGYKTHVKYWCKGSDWSSCAAIVRTDSPHEGKVSVRDDPDQQVFTVTMNNLTDGDSGSYWCGVEISKGSAVGKRVSLSVPEGKMSGLIVTKDDDEGGNNEKQSSLVQLALYVGLGLFVLLLIIIIITWKVWDIRKKKRAMDQNPGSTELSVSSRCSSHHSAVRSANNVVYSSFTMKHIE